MFSNKRAYAARARQVLALGSPIALAILVGACSADVTRFDFPVFGLTDKGGETGSLPAPPQTVGRRGYEDPASGAPRGAGLGEAGRGAGPATYSSPLPNTSLPPANSGTGERFANARDYPPAPAADPAPGTERYAGRPMDRSRAAARGETIQVQEGDTLYSLAKRHGVSLAALIETNGLAHGSTIKPGQQLLLPPGAPAARAPAARAPAARALGEPLTAGRTPLARGAMAPAPAATPIPTGGWEGRHTLRPGESLYGIARQHGVTLAELQRVNGISEPTRVRAGIVLSVPGSAPAADLAPLSAQSGVPAAVPAAVPVSAGQPRILNPPAVEHKTAALTDRSNDAAEAAAEPGSASGLFRWPARGRLIAAFGKRPDGSNNDGINIAVPQGTEVHAAESGRVAYAGDELKGYGNLVLIRHSNGWVSAYAHADQILVKRDDVVRRGQVIAKAGKTGTVDQPQLHFELRQGAKPVDPLPHLEK
jgi:murein DD-endopeptidase MepM/ murein hydrolase activator NlpD